jgi:surfactin family lipopeptide synthetase A
MQKTTDLSEARRALLDRYLRGNLPQTAAPVSGISRRAASGPAPLSFGQQQLWLLAQLMPDTPMYNESTTLRITGALDVAVLEKSLNEFINRHEAWRTIFPIIDEQPAQVVQPAMPLQLPVIDLSNLPETEREDEALRLATENALQPFNLAQGPLLRAILVHLNENDHRLYMTLHHIIFDAVAIYQIFLPELYMLYEAFSRAEASPLAPLALQYADFATWQREVQHKEAVAKELAYWKEQLAGIPQVLELPSDHLRPAVQRYRGSAQTFAFSRRLTEALKALSRQEGVTLYMTVTAAFQTLLHRYTGQNDLVIGTVTSDRKRPEVQGLVGYFLNTLVLRANMDGDPTFREMLGRVREVVLSARRHEDVPFEYVVKELHPERTLSYSPVVQVLLAYQPSLPELPANWSCSQMDVQTNTAKFDLSVEIEERADGLIGRFVYNTDLFEDATIERMIGHMETLLEGIVANPEQQIEKLPLLKEDEKRTLLVDWNATQVAYPEDVCLHQLIEEQVARTPQAIAVSFEQERLTYRELNKRANRLAHRLRELGVGPDVLVAVCMHRSLELVVGLLAILKAGGAYVPVDPDYPQDRITFMLEDAQAPVFLTQSHLLGQLPASQAKVLCVDSEGPALARYSAENPEREVQPHHLAYVIYTSGSTGHPKGAGVFHRAEVNLLYWYRETFAIGAQDHVLLISSIGFDLTQKNLFAPLLAGGTVHLVPDKYYDPQRLIKQIYEQQITLINCTPSTFYPLIEHLQPQEWGQLASLRYLVLGGEPIALQRLSPWLRSSYCRAKVANTYGPTECTDIALSFVLASEEEYQGGSIPLGRPIPNVQVVILDKKLQPVPIGVAGELHIGGIGIGCGYLNRPELTAQKFIKNPFSTEADARLYKTGDLARYLPDGTIEYLGRLDHQVKIRGFRIELGEIESVLESHAAVREAAVVAREDVPGDKRLVAYVTLQAGESASTSELQQHLQQQLPAFMVPSAFVLLEKMPISSNGKLDRRALPAPEITREASEDAYVEPTSLVQGQLVQIWEELLDVRPIGIKDNFFSLGGHSLLAARLIEKIHQVCGKKIALATLFAGPTVEQLAIAMTQDVSSTDYTSVVAVQASGSLRPFFFLHGDWTGGAFYCFTLARSLGADQPFYVLETYKTAGLRKLSCLEEMAAAHVEALRAAQPEGPYRLGGFCNGGLLAYEVARQLEEAGEQVDFLGLINPSMANEPDILLSVIGRIGEVLRVKPDTEAHWYLRARHALRHVFRFMRPDDARLADFHKLTAMDSRLERMFPPLEALYNDYVGVFGWLVSRYKLRAYKGKIDFYWAADEPYIQEGWEQVPMVKDKQEIEHHLVPGTHMSCVTDYTEVLAERLSESLSRSQQAELSQLV